MGERTVLVLGTQCSSHYRTVTAGGVAGVIGSFRPKAATCASLTFCVRAELLWDGPGNHDVIAFGVIHSGSDDVIRNTTLCFSRRPTGGAAFDTKLNVNGCLVYIGTAAGVPRDVT